MSLESSAESRWNRFAIYGLALVTDFPIRCDPPSAGAEQRELRFTCAQTEELPQIEQTELLFTSRFLNLKGESVARIYSWHGGRVFHAQGVGQFWMDRNQILCRSETDDQRLIEVSLLGNVLSYWLETQRIPAIHASCVEVAGSAVLFLSTGRGGKTSLAASLMQQGHALMSDDVVPLRLENGRVLASPAYPQMKMWPDDARFFLDRAERLERVHPSVDKVRVQVGFRNFGKFCDKPRPIKACYLPERSEIEGPVTFERLSQTEALLELNRHSFAAATVPSAGRMAERFDLLAQVVQQVPIRRLLIPSGLERLNEFNEAITRDLELISLE